MCVQIYIHMYMLHTFIDLQIMHIFEYMHTYVCTHIHTFIHTHIHAYIPVLSGIPVFSYITIYIPVLQYDITKVCYIIDQNYFRNIIRTSLSNSRNSFGSIWNNWFCNEKINTKAIVQGKNSNFERILKCSQF